MAELFALDRYLQERGLPISRARWDSAAALVGSLNGGNDAQGGITALRQWEVMRRFFRLAADSLASDHPPLAEKLRRATHWMRHTHATHALAKGVA